jgi:hypothetical protein
MRGAQAAKTEKTDSVDAFGYLAEHRVGKCLAAERWDVTCSLVRNRHVYSPTSAQLKNLPSVTVTDWVAVRPIEGFWLHTSS